MLTVYIRSNLLYFSRNMINEICHLSSKVEIMVSICLITRCKYKNRLGLGAVLGILQFQLLFRRIFLAFRLDFGAVLEILAVSATFSRIFSGFWTEFGCCFVDFCSFSYFFPGLFRLLGWIRELFWRFWQFQLLFPGIFPAFGLD